MSLSITFLSFQRKKFFHRFCLKNMRGDFPGMCDRFKKNKNHRHLIKKQRAAVSREQSHVLPAQNRICQNHFFKIQFSDVFLILWDSCDKK